MKTWIWNRSFLKYMKSCLRFFIFYYRNWHVNILYCIVLYCKRVYCICVCVCLDQTAGEVTSDAQMKMLLGIRSNQNVSQTIHRHEGLLFKVSTNWVTSITSEWLCFHGLFDCTRTFSLIFYSFMDLEQSVLVNGLFRSSSSHQYSV